MEFLCGFTFVVALVAVVGHGIWVFFAAVFRAMAGGAAGPERRAEAPSYSPGTSGCLLCEFMSMTFQEQLVLASVHPRREP